jgi:hypothetical protein
MRRLDDLDYREIPPIPGPYTGGREMNVRSGVGPSVRISRIGEKSDKGCLVGIQPAWEPWRFRTEIDFRSALYELLEDAKQAGFLSGKSLVVLPELAPLLLLLVNEFPWVTLSETWSKALSTALTDEKAWRMIKLVPHAVELGWEKAAYLEVIEAKLQRALEVWVEAFSAAALDYQTEILAGSMIMPRTVRAEGGLSFPHSFSAAEDLGSGALLFGSDGGIAPQIIWKRNPSGFETSHFVQPVNGPAPTFETPIGKLAVLLGEDSWDDEMAAQTKEADIIVAPSCAWAGDDRADWRERGVNSWIHNTKATAGMTLFNSNNLFERRMIGQPLLWRQGSSYALSNSQGGEQEAHIVGLWL